MPVLVLVEPIELVEMVMLAKAGALVLVGVLAPAIASEVVVVVRVLVSARFEAELLATDELLDAAAVEANIPLWKELVLILLSTFGLVTEPGSSIPIINTRSRASATPPTIIVEMAGRPSTK
jgi:hypothetical protein